MWTELKTLIKSQLGLSDWGIMAVQILSILLLMLLISFITSKIFAHLEKKVSASQNNWDDAFFAAVRKPFRLLIWILGLSFIGHLISNQTSVPIFSITSLLRDIGIAAVISWFLIRLTRQVEQNLIARKKSNDGADDTTTIEAVGKLIRLTIIIICTLVIVETLGYSISGVLAFGGISGIAVGFAARDLLANFFGAIMIYLDRPFVTGNWIRSPDRDIEGTVETIGWRLTRIRRFDKRMLYVPNAIFTSIAVENPSRMSHRRIYETVGIRYDDIAKMHSIVNAVKAMLAEHSDIDGEQTLIVNFDAFNASSVDFFIYAFTKTTNWIKFHEVKQDVLLKVAQIIEDQKAEIAFPTQTLLIGENGASALAAHHEPAKGAN